MDSEADESCSGSIPEVAVIETEDIPDDQATSESQPMVVEDDASEQEAPQEPKDADFGEWLQGCRKVLK